MLWAVTSYFNPNQYHNRRETFRMFRQNLEVPLIAAELGFDNRFELDASDAEILIQVGDGDVMFQKERLLSLAMQALPPECTAVAWLDCDVVFDSPDWGEKTLKRLQTFELVQPFGKLYRLQRGDPQNFESARRSIPPMFSLAKQWNEGQVDPHFWATTQGAKLPFRGGIAWAARREFFERFSLYDSCILGSGDRAFLCALLNVEFVTTDFLQMSPRFKQHYLEWASQFRKHPPIPFSYIDSEVLQLWHGEYLNRRYQDRYLGFSQFDFDPRRDLCLGREGCWKWTDSESEMANYAKSYFTSRQEDG